MRGCMNAFGTSARTQQIAPMIPRSAAGLPRTISIVTFEQTRDRQSSHGLRLDPGAAKQAALAMTKPSGFGSLNQPVHAVASQMIRQAALPLGRKVPAPIQTAHANRLESPIRL